MDLKPNYYWCDNDGFECVMQYGPDGSDTLQWWDMGDESPMPLEGLAWHKVLEPIPTRDELRELREKAGKWDAVLDATNFGLVDAEMVNHIAAHGAKWPRKATP